MFFMQNICFFCRTYVFNAEHMLYPGHMFFYLGERPMLCMAETIPYFVFVYFIAVVIATVRYISSM